MEMFIYIMKSLQFMRIHMNTRWICILLLLVAGWGICCASEPEAGSDMGSDAGVDDQEIPNLVGHWIIEAKGGVIEKGEELGEYTHHEGKFSTLTADVNITEQQGRVFFCEFSAARGANETMIGAIGHDNKTVKMVDMDGVVTGELVSDDLIEVVYTHITDKDSVIAVGTWTRAS